MVAGQEMNFPNDGTGMFSPMQFYKGNINFLIGVVQLDPWLAPFKESLRHRYRKAQEWITAINESEGSLEKFSRVRAKLFELRTTYR
jgi:hypothetical protein